MNMKFVCDSKGRHLNWEDFPPQDIHRELRLSNTFDRAQNHKGFFLGYNIGKGAIAITMTYGHDNVELNL